MRALRRAWSAAHGDRSVVGLAPSAAAAEVLAGDLGIPCENTAKWLHDHDHGGPTFTACQLVIIDEATLAGTMALDRLTALAGEAGAKVLLVGDWAQIQSVDAGGAFALLADARDDTPELVEVHRFTHEWEKQASLDLRHARTEVIVTYLHHERVKEGTTEEMLHEAYAAWRGDVRAGLSSVLVTESAQAVSALNQRARAERITTGETEASREVELADGNGASAGDLIITRRNDRRLRTRPGGFVRNGDRWMVVDVRKDGSIVARRQGHRIGASVALPAAYVADHVDLGYAVTAHRAQGVTVDTAHVVVTRCTTRENFYVSMTRGRDSNIAYVALDMPDTAHASPPEDEVTVRTVLYGVLRHSGAELSAHQTIEAEQERWSSIAQLAAEYETIAAEAQRDRWVTLVRGSGLTEEQADAVVTSDSFGPLTAELRRAEANDYSLATLFPAIVAQRSLGDAEDIGAVLLDRLRNATARAVGVRGRRPAHLVAGLIPKVQGAVAADMARALREREELIESRARALAGMAIESKAPWLRRLGMVPARPRDRERWMEAAMTVAAYRDRYQIDVPSALGPGPESIAQRLDYARAEAAVRLAEGISREAAQAGTPQVGAGVEPPRPLGH
jgi:AAA domain